MTYAPRITDESVISRWMGIELKAINRGIAKERKQLSALLDEAEPSSITKTGEPYKFRKEIITGLGEKLPRDMHRRLKLPVLFYCTPDVPGSCWCSDIAAFETLQILGEINPLRTLEGGKFWVSRAIVFAILRKYPTAFQIVLGP